MDLPVPLPPTRPMRSWRDEPVDVFEEEFVAETFSGARKLDHETALSSHKTSGVLNVVPREMRRK